VRANEQGGHAMRADMSDGDGTIVPLKSLLALSPFVPSHHQVPCI